MKEKDSSNKYFKRLNKLFNQMKSHENTIKDKRISDTTLVIIEENINTCQTSVKGGIE